MTKEYLRKKRDEDVKEDINVVSVEKGAGVDLETSIDGSDVGVVANDGFGNKFNRDGGSGGYVQNNDGGIPEMRSNAILFNKIPSESQRLGGDYSYNTPKVEDKDINYKNIDLLLKFISDKGRILSRKYTGLSRKQQKKVSEAVKQARNIGLLPFSRLD